MLFSIFFYLLIPIVILAFDCISKLVINCIFKNIKTTSVKLFKWNFSKDKIHCILNAAFCVLFLTCVCAFRSISVGNDTRSYYNFYIESGSYTLEKVLKGNANYETGYVFVNFFLSSIGVPYYAFAFIIYFIIFTAVVWCSFKFSKFPIVSVCLYVCFTFFVLNLSTLRQSLAFAICLYSLLIFSAKKSLFFKALAIIPIIIATTIHKSSAIFLLVYVIYYIRIKTINSLVIFTGLLSILVMFFPAISSILFQRLTNPSKVYSFYPPSSSQTDISGTLILLILVTSTFVICKVFSFKFDLSFSKSKLLKKIRIFDFCETTFNNFDVDDQIVFALSIFQILFILLDNTIFLLSRVATYGSLGFCCLLPNLVSNISKNRPNNLLMIGIVLFGVLYFYYTVLRINYLNILPYGVF